MTQVSVIIPVYNTEKYLPKCLESVCNQTLKDIEIICVNDASPDNSLAVLQEYAKNDNRIKLINFTENKGAAAARNAGIDAATGEYIGFVDSDDFVDLDFYEKLYTKAKETDADAVKGNYKDAQTGQIDFSLNEKIKEDKNNFSFAYCSAIFRKKIIDDFSVRFPLLKDMEDPVFTLQFALRANKAVIDDSACVNIVKRPDSLTSGILSLQQIKDKFSGLRQIVSMLNEEELKNGTYAFIASFWLWQTYINSIKHTEKENYIFIADGIFTVFQSLKLKGSILLKLEDYSRGFSTALKNSDLYSLAHYVEESQKDRIFSALRRNIKKEMKCQKLVS